MTHNMSHNEKGCLSFACSLITIILFISGITLFFKNVYPVKPTKGILNNYQIGSKICSCNKDCSISLFCFVCSFFRLYTIELIIIKTILI